jgi:putative NADH-flavin reductase
VHVLVFGATGPLGREIVVQALAAGHAVTVFVRDPARLSHRPDLLRVLCGDVLDAAAARASVSGQDAVLSALGHSSRKSPMLYPAATHIVAGMIEAGVRRLVWVSSHGVGDSRGRSGVVFERLLIPLMLRAEFADKQRQESVVNGSGLDWTIVRPARLTNGPRRGGNRTAHRLRLRAWSAISRADTAGFVVDELTRRAYLRQAPTIAY